MMGSCCTVRCPNTAHAWQLGWINVRQLDASSLKPGQTVTVAMPSQGLSQKSGLRIVPGWAAGVDTIYVGYRTKAGGDSWVGPAVASPPAGRVHIYTSAIANRLDPKFTVWKAALDTPGQAWELRQAGLVVRLRSSNSAAAALTVCRKAKGGVETRESCAAGVDADCNGRAGARDAACAKFRRTRQL